MSQSSEDGNIWGDTSSSFEDQLYNTAVIAEQRVVLSRQTRPATVGNTEARSTTNYANISLQKENMFHVYRDPQPNISTLRNLQMHAAPLGDLSNKSNNKRTSDSKIDGKEQGIKKKRTICIPEDTKEAMAVQPRTETHSPAAETSGFSSLLHSKDIAAPKQDHSADDEDDYMWMEFDVDLNALLESVEAKGAPSSTQFDTNPDPKEITEVHQQTVVDEQHSSEEEVNVHGVDHRHFESNLSKFGGFMTAGSKKALDANPEARKKALALFETTSDKHTNDDPDQNGVRAQFSQSLPPKSFGGFTTASGKNMTAPTKEALSKAELLFSKTDTLQPLRDVLSKESASGPTNHTKDINNGLTSFECQHGYDEISQRDMNQSMSGLEDDQVGFKYEDVLSRYGGFKTANSKGDFIVSAEAKRQAVALFNASESARDLTQSTQSQRVPCSPPRSEPSDSNSQQKHCQQPQLSSPQINNGDRDLCNPGCLNSPEMTPESKRVEKTPKIIAAPGPSLRRIARKHGAGSFKHFKSPIINENIELTKAAVCYQTSSRNQSSNPCVFRMEASGPRMSLKSFGEPGIYTRNQLLAMNIPSAAVDMTAAAAKDHRFYGWGPQEARKAMIRAGALEKFIPLAWVENHYRWIVWKIAGMIRSFPRHLKDWWSPKKILDQLLYRYEREINLGHRSALKRIIEQDDVPGKLMILVIVDITKGHASESNQSHDSKKYELLLSDGWYQVTAVADTRLERAISRGRLTIGYKLAICGAQTNVFPRAPTSTSTPGNTVLTIASNGCRIAPWDAKLGYQRRRLEYRSLNSLHNDGGVVTAIDVIVCRKYPIMYSETLSDGSVVVRTAREEEEARREALSRLCGYGNDDWAPSFSEHSQSVISQQYSKLLEDRHAPTPIANEERKVSGYFRVRVCDIPAGGNKPKTTATLLQLDANEVLHMDICEGGRYRIYFLAPYLPRSKRYPGLNLKSTRKIHWEPVIKRCGTAEFSAPSLYIPRHITTCDKIPHDISEEVDMVVVVLCVTSTEKRRQPSGKIIWYQKLLVSDESKALVQVTIRLTSRPLSHPEGQVIAFTNAQFEMHDAKYEVTHMRISEESEIIIRPFSSAEYLQKAISSLREWVQKYPENVESLRQHINEKLLHH